MTSQGDGPQSIRSSAQAFTRGADIGVDVTGIERELASLWRQASTEHAVTRACSWNLLVHVGEGRDLDAARALVDRVVFPVPSRAIVLVPRPNDAGKEVEAFVSANCQVAPGGGKLLCSEEITVMSRGAGERYVPSLVRALLVPDVPTALLWVGAPPADPRVIPYFPSVDRLLFDSADAAADLARTYATLAKDPLHKDKTLVDLAWLRTGFLRSLLATMFDPPTGAGPLERATELSIRAAQNGGSSARLFAGWVASRLGWVMELGIGAAGGSGRSKATSIKVGVSVDSARATPSGLSSITIKTSDEGGAPAEFELSDNGDGTLNVQSHGQSSRTKIAADLAEERLVIAALGARGRDPLFKTALDIVAFGAQAAKSRSGSP